jgi:hypothetical protein
VPPDPPTCSGQFFVYYTSAREDVQGAMASYIQWAMHQVDVFRAMHQVDVFRTLSPGECLECFLLYTSVAIHKLQSAPAPPELYREVSASE